MQSNWSLISMALTALIVCARGQTSYFRRTYYSPLAAPATHYYQHNHGVMPPMAAAAYSGGIDLASEESKQQREASPKRYGKKSSYLPYGSEEDEVSSERYSSGEYSNEAQSYNSKENDSREYTIGTQIRVQHPISITKKPSHSKTNKYLSSSAYKSGRGAGGGSGGGVGGFGELNLAGDGLDSRPPQHTSKKHASHNKYTEIFDADPIHVIAPPKHIGPSALASSGYSVYEPEEHDYDVAASPSTRSKAHLIDRFKGVASKKQIEKYLEDQQKLLDEALKLQLLSNPKFKKLFKNKGHEFYEDHQQYEHELPPEPLSAFRSHAHAHSHSHFDDNISVKSSRPRRRPHAGEPPRPPKIIKSSGGHSKPRRFRSALVINV